MRRGSAQWLARYPAAMAQAPTAPLAAGTLVAGYAVAVASGSRPLGGLVLAAGGLTCMELWRRRDGARTAFGLGGAGLAAFAGSHGLARLVGAWPSVLIVAGAMAALAWRLSDSGRLPSRAAGGALGS